VLRFDGVGVMVGVVLPARDKWQREFLDLTLLIPLSLLLDSETDLDGLEGCLNHGVITKSLRGLSRVAFCA
jgi:hypothetical protein